MIISSGMSTPDSHDTPLARQAVEYPLSGGHETIVLGTNPFNLFIEVLRNRYSGAPHHIRDIIAERIRGRDLRSGEPETQRQAVDTSKAQGQLCRRVLIDRISLEKSENGVEVFFGKCFAIAQLVVRDIAGVSDLIANAANQFDQPHGFRSSRQFSLPDCDPSCPDCCENCGYGANSLKPRGPVNPRADDLKCNAHSANAVMILGAAA